MTLKYRVKPAQKVPKRLRSTPRLTIAEIAAKTPAATRKKARVVRINGARIARTPSFLEGWTVYRVDTQNTENGHRYIVTVFSPTPRIKSSSKVMIDDPNPLAVFRYEYALARRGNAFIYRTNGQPPVQTNPSNTPGLSHHGYAALKFLVRESRALAKKNEQ